MYRNTILFTVIAIITAIPPAEAQHNHAHPDPHIHGREVVFPDIPGYHTMSTDLHIHTVFSDGSVWPDIRVQEALKDNLDVIAITDHLEYQPHKADIPHPDRNRSYEIAAGQVDEEELIIINGSEITRDMPPGHSNAVFVQDANKLLVDDVKGAFRAAVEQDAFTFWNHPSWLSQSDDGTPPLSDLHRELIDEGLLHGIEVVNHHRYSKEALQIALDYGLTIIGTSDVHGLIDWDYEVHHGEHRPVTLVFAKEYSKQGLKEALFDGRTVVWKEDLLIGREEYLVPLIEASLEITESYYLGDTSVLQVEIKNSTGQTFLLENKSEYSLHHNTDIITLKPYSISTFQVMTLERLDQIHWPLEVLNGITAPDTHPVITLETVID
ncbi:MAG: Sb-PDE family phosphodiesterase [Balneolaceae bacterium]